MIREIIFLEDVQTAKLLVRRLEQLSLSPQENTDIVVMLNEFDLNIDDVMMHNKAIADAVQEKGITLIMAPTYNDSETYSLTCEIRELPMYKGNLGNSLLELQKSLDPTFDGNAVVTEELTRKIPWTTLSHRLNKRNISTERINVTNNERIDSIGFFYGKNGLVYAFPKSWDQQPIHVIPETKIGVTICGEIQLLRHENLEGLEVVYNPASERDDPYLPLRMKALVSPNMGKEAVRHWLENTRAHYSGLRTKQKTECTDAELERLSSFHQEAGEPPVSMYSGYFPHLIS